VEGDLQRVVGDNLKAYRKARGLSQEALAHVFGWGRAYMGELERGECNLTLRTLERYASRIGIEPLALLTPDVTG
jgi:transcriptional regulator with XRE-family HTH domain